MVLSIFILVYSLRDVVPWRLEPEISWVSLPGYPLSYISYKDHGYPDITA